MPTGPGPIKAGLGNIGPPRLPDPTGALQHQADNHELVIQGELGAPRMMVKQCPPIQPYAIPYHTICISRLSRRDNAGGTELISQPTLAWCHIASLHWQAVGPPLPLSCCCCHPWPKQTLTSASRPYHKGMVWHNKIQHSQCSLCV